MMEIVERLRVGTPCVHRNLLGMGCASAIYLDWLPGFVSGDTTSTRPLVCLVSQVISKSKALAESIVNNWLNGKQVLRHRFIAQVSRLDEVQKILARAIRFGIVFRVHALRSLLEAMRIFHHLLTDFVANNFRRTNAVKNFLFENSAGDIFSEIELRNPAWVTSQQPAKSFWSHAKKTVVWTLCREQKNRELLLAVETCGESLVKLASATVTSTSPAHIDHFVDGNTQSPVNVPVDINPKCRLSIEEHRSEILAGWASNVNMLTISIPAWVTNTPR
jgi:hypothetical protein